MDLETVLELQRELIGRGLNRPAAWEILADGRRVPPIALGVTGSAGEFILAVRVLTQSPATVARVEAIVAEADGKAEIRFVGKLKAQALAVGGPVGRSGSSPGTLGAVVRDSENGVPLLLSAAHVLTDIGSGVGDAVYEPAPALGIGGRVQVGRLFRFTPLSQIAVNTVDAAVATIEAGTFPPQNHLPGVGNINGVRFAPLQKGTPVAKVGNGSGRRLGRISAWNLAPLACSTAIGDLLYGAQIEIERTGTKPFSIDGDSGALVVDEAVQAVGLLTAGNGIDVSYASPIAAVLREMMCDLF